MTFRQAWGGGLPLPTSQVGQNKFSVTDVIEDEICCSYSSDLGFEKEGWGGQFYKCYTVAVGRRFIRLHHRSLG